MTKWVNSTEWAHFLAKDVSTRSSTSVCLTLDTDPANVKAMVKMLEEADVAYDIGAYRDAPAGLKTGRDRQHGRPGALFPWIERAARNCPRSVSVDTPSPPSHRRRPFPALSRVQVLRLLSITGCEGGAVPGGRHRASPIHRRRAGRRRRVGRYIGGARASPSLPRLLRNIVTKNPRTARIRPQLAEVQLRRGRFGAADHRRPPTGRFCTRSPGRRACGPARNHPARVLPPCLNKYFCNKTRA